MAGLPRYDRLRQFYAVLRAYALTDNALMTTQRDGISYAVARLHEIRLVRALSVPLKEEALERSIDNVVKSAVT